MTDQACGYDIDIDIMALRRDPDELLNALRETRGHLRSAGDELAELRIELAGLRPIVEAARVWISESEACDARSPIVTPDNCRCGELREAFLWEMNKRFGIPTGVPRPPWFAAAHGTERLWRSVYSQ